MYLWQQILFSCQIYIQPNIFDKYTSTVFLPVVKMATSLNTTYFIVENFLDTTKQYLIKAQEFLIHRMTELVRKLWGTVKTNERTRYINY